MINRRGSVKSVFAEMISDWKAAGQRERARRRSAKRRQVNRTPAAGEGLESRLVLSALTISTDVSAVGDITETSPDEATTGDDLTIQSGVTVESQSGLVALNVGDDLFIEAGASVISSQAIAINLDFGDADAGVGSTAVIEGTISSSFTQLNAISVDPINVTIGSAARQAGWTINGNAGDDTLTVDLSGIDDAELFSDGMGGGSIVSSSALIGIEFFDIENVNTQGNGFASFELNNLAVEDASDDTVTVTLDGTGNHFIIQRNGVTVQTVPVSVGELTITGSDDNDTLVIDHSAGIIGATINFVGGNGNDSLVVIGNGTTSSVYTPGAIGAGVVTVDGGGGTINFTGLEPVDISGMATATLTLPGANDVLTIADGFDFATGIEPDRKSVV